MLYSWKLWIVWCSIIALIGLLGFGFTKDPKKVPSPLIGKSAPDFEFKLLFTVYLLVLLFLTNQLVVEIQL